MGVAAPDKRGELPQNLLFILSFNSLFIFFLNSSLTMYSIYAKILRFLLETRKQFCFVMEFADVLFNKQAKARMRLVHFRCIFYLPRY